MGKVAETHALSVFKSQLTPLAPFMDDSSVQEIMVNSPDVVWIERAGVMFQAQNIHISDTAMRGAVKALAGANSKDVAPVLDCRMTGYRIAAVLAPVGVNGNALCIRKHSRSRRRLSDYLESGALDVIKDSRTAALENSRPSDEDVAKGGKHLVDLLKWIVASKRNMAVAGSTGSGKTTFLNAMLAEIPDGERVLTIEDTAELQVAASNYVGLEVDEASGVDVRRLVKLSLRFRPDRIIVGEVRGPEAYDLLDAMNTGHSGGACSLHADNPLFALARLESMVRMNPDATNLPLSALRTQIANTIDFVVYCAQSGDIRGPEEIAEVVGVVNGEYSLKTLYKRHSLNS